NLDAYLAATQLGITLASLGLGWIGEGVVSEIILASMHGLGVEMSEAAAHQIALPTSFALITVLHIVFGELAPKSLAIRFPTNTTLWTAVPLRLFYLVFRPFIWLLNNIANAFLKLIGIQPVPHAEVHSEEELKLIIAESAEGGAIRSSERELIQNVFDFDDRLVRQVLKPRTQVTSMEIHTPLRDAIETALQEGYSRYPVYEDSIDNIIGFVTTKDLLASEYREEQKGLKELVRPVIFTTSSRKVGPLLRQMQRERAQLAVIVNEFGGTVGLVTMEDILEELVGEIQDEYDTEHPIVEDIGERKFRVLAQNPIDEINQYLPEPLPENNEYVTLSGLI
ncbi:MAG TPA: hemolysin family protein, partial [Saprospiraceae bacterium]|nr:hemolysin family protein [Saprospiraceae bacterium]